MKIKILAAMIMLCPAVLLAADAGYYSNQYQDDEPNKFAHYINLLDANGHEISPASLKTDSVQTGKFSARITCGRCHEYDSISEGLHFKATDYIGQGLCWIYEDRLTASRFAVSVSGRKGTFTPKTIGISAEEFAKVTGWKYPLAIETAEINCLVCHEVSGDFNENKNDAKNFDQHNMAWLDIDKHVPNDNCLKCHSSILGNADIDKDSHLAELNCISCHTNEIDHNMGQGNNHETDYELTCQGCHYTGNLDALTPKHKGIPAVHFAKLTCSACHSQITPGQKAISDFSQSNVTGGFTKNDCGKIQASQMFWPAYWGSIKTDSQTQQKTITPISLTKLKPIAEKILADNKPFELTINDIEKMLKAVKNHLAINNSAYLSAETLYRLDQNDKIITEPNCPLAKPYIWPKGHPVSKKEKSLGAKSCEQCHSQNSAFIFGNIATDSTVIGQSKNKQMYRYQNIDGFYHKLFAISFVFRPMLKVVTIACCFMLSIIMITYAVKTIVFILKIIAKKD